MPTIHSHIANFRPMTYATDHVPPEDILDCSLGVNPYGCPPSALEAVRGIALRDLSHYPHGNELQEAIVRHWAPLVELEPGNIVLGNGSMPLLVNSNRLFLSPGSRVYGLLPGFSGYTDDVNVSGATYSGYCITPDTAVQEVAKGFLAGLEECRPDMVFLENPNNPTGLALGPEEVEEIVSKAGEMGIPILVDEAYGDYLPAAQSAVRLVPRYAGLIVTRTFSKGLGLASFRLGYAVTGRRVAENLIKTGSVFDGNAPGRVAAQAALEDRAFAEQTVDRIRADKARLLGALKNLRVYPTAPATPIMTLYTDPEIDLYGHLLRHGINAVPGVSFETVGRRGVRLILHDNIDELLRRLASADAAIV